MADWKPDISQYTRNPHLALAGFASLAAIAYYAYSLYDNAKKPAKDGVAAEAPKPKASGQQDEALPELFGDGKEPLVAYVGGVEQGVDFPKAVYPIPALDHARGRAQADDFPKQRP